MIRAAQHGAARRNDMIDMLPDLTPMMDVFFMLLVFFLLTANSVEHVLELDLPREGAEQAVPLDTVEPIVLTLNAQAPYWRVDDQTLQDWSAVEAAVDAAHAQRPEAQVLIAGDRSVPMERLLQALAYLQREGLTAAQILMEAGTQDRSIHTNPTQ
jgi:biopolymer transport protein ExbD